jgi:thiol-disulfide isomerase/thioredoxin
VDSDKSPLGPVAHVAFVIVAAIGVYSFVSVAKEGESRRACSAACLLHPTYSGYERKAPNFTLKDTHGRDVSLDSYRGKVVILNFWTKTCGPCMEEMPEIAELARILEPKKDVAVLTVSSDETAKEASDALKTVLRGDPPFPVLIDPDVKVTKDAFGTSLYPETWIIDKNGVIRARFDGAREWSNAAVVQFVDQIRNGEYCPLVAKQSKLDRNSARLCDGITGG